MKIGHFEDKSEQQLEWWYSCIVEYLKEKDMVKTPDCSYAVFIKEKLPQVWEKYMLQKENQEACFLYFFLIRMQNRQGNPLKNIINSVNIRTLSCCSSEGFISREPCRKQSKKSINRIKNSKINISQRMQIILFLIILKDLHNNLCFCVYDTSKLRCRQTKFVGGK